MRDLEWGGTIEWRTTPRSQTWAVIEDGPSAREERKRNRCEGVWGEMMTSRFSTD